MMRQHTQRMGTGKRTTNKQSSGEEQDEDEPGNASGEGRILGMHRKNKRNTFLKEKLFLHKQFRLYRYTFCSRIPLLFMLT